MINISCTARVLLRLQIRIRPFVTSCFLTLSINSFVSVTGDLSLVKCVIFIFDFKPHSVLVLSSLRVEL